MRIAYLIAAHDRPRQLERLAEKLLAASDQDFAVIHADRRSALWADRAQLKLPPRARLVTDPVAVHWGHWSQVAATHRLIREAIAEGCEAAHFISGKDWPIAPRDRVAAELADGHCHIEAVRGHMEGRMQTFRVDTRMLQVEGSAWPVRQCAWELRRLARLTDRMGAALGLRRSQPFGQWHYGSAWWSLPRYALDRVERDLGELLGSGRLRGTLCSDEHAIQTIVARHWPERIAPHRRFILWPQDRGASSPRTLTGNDLPQIAESTAWFARKCDAEVDAFFLDQGTGETRFAA